MKIVNLFIEDFVDLCNVFGFGKIILHIETKIHIRVETCRDMFIIFSVNGDGYSSTCPDLGLGQGWRKDYIIRTRMG